VAPGPWLVLGYIGEQVRLRPLLLTVPGKEPDPSPPNSSASEFDAAVRTSPKDARLSALRTALGKMAANLDHPDWRRVQRHVATLGRLPATTFDVVRVLSEVPDAAVAALLLCGDGLEMTWTGLEELPFSWALVPVKSWVRGVKALMRSADAKDELWRTLGWDRARARIETLKLFWERGPKQALFMATILEVVCMTSSGVPPPPQHLVSVARTPEGRRSLESLLTRQRTAMLARHAASDDWWPEGDVRALALQAGITPAILDEVHIPADLGHRADVYDAPGVAAAISVLGVPCPLPLLLQIRRLRSFDETWFDMAHATALTNLLGRRFAKDKGLFDDA
jgi:hypothetical protein